MTDPRLPPARERRTSKARFRCPVCERFVQATDYGVCPHCGLGPPQMIDIAPARTSAGYWVGAALFALAIGLGGALLAVC